MHGEHPLSRLQEIVNSPLRCITPPRALIVVQQNVIVGQRSGCDPAHLFFDLHIEAPGIHERLLQVYGGCEPGMRVVGRSGKDQDPNLRSSRLWLGCWSLSG